MLLMLVVCAGCGGRGPSADDATRAQKEYELAVGLWQESNTAGAFQHLFRALELDPDNAEAHMLLGNLYLFRREDAKAEKEFREVLRIEKRSPAARNSLGVLYMHQGKFEKAIAELKIATGDLLNRESHLAWGNLGWAYYHSKQYGDAEQALLQSIRAEPRFCVGYYRLGVNYEAMGNFEKAEEALTKGLEVKVPGCATLQEALYERAMVRIRLGRNDAAVSDLERCVEVKAEGPLSTSCQQKLVSLQK